MYHVVQYDHDDALPSMQEKLLSTRDVWDHRSARQHKYTFCQIENIFVNFAIIQCIQNSTVVYIEKKRTKEHHNIKPQLSNVYLLQEQTTCIRYIVYCKDEKYDFQYDHIIFETDDYFRPVVDLFSLISLSDGQLGIIFYELQWSLIAITFLTKVFTDHGQIKQWHSEWS